MNPTQPPNSAKDGEKKTRDLPKLTECHSCGFRVDTCTTSGKQKLQPLYSEWRIVLLCNKCYTQVESFQVCSYCFRESTSSTDDDDDCLNCRLCKRLVHKSCFAKHASAALWSGSGSGSGSPVCVDCWVPKCVARKREVRVRSLRRRECSTGDLGEKCLEDEVKDAKTTAEMKAEVAIRARDLAVRKALAARKAADMAMEALELFAEFGGIGEEGNGDNDGGRKMAVDNAMSELQSLRTGDKGLVFFRRKRRGISLAEKLLGGLCFRNAGACGEDGDCGCKIVSYPLVYSRSRWKVKDRNLDLRLDGEESCSNKVINSNGNDNSMNPMSPCSVEGNESVAVEDEFSYGNDDPRYFFKYSRRKLNGSSMPERRLKHLFDRLLHDHQASGPGGGLPFSCSKESATFSITLPQSCSFSLQTSGCSSGLSRDQS